MMQYTLFLVLAPIACLVVAGALVSTYRVRTTREVSTFVLLLCAVEGWLVCNSLELAAGTERWTLFWAKVTYLFIATTPVAWLAFMVQYAGKRHWLRSPLYWLSGVIPTMTLLLVWTNESHRLVWQDARFLPVGQVLALNVIHGPWFWIHVTQSYAMVLLGTLLVSYSYVGYSPSYRKQLRWFVWGGFVPVVWNLIYVLRVVPNLQKDYTPIGLALSVLFFAIGMARDRLLDVKPLARGRVFDTMRDAVIVTDAANRLVDANPAARELMSALRPEPGITGCTGRPLAEILDTWPALLEHLVSANLEPLDLLFPSDDQQRAYECRILALEDYTQQPMGRVIVLHDITERYISEGALKGHLAELTASYEQLDDFAGTVAHDLVSPLSTIIGFAETLKLGIEELPPDEVRQQLDILLRSGHRMARTIDALLLLARAHQQDDLACEAFDMGYVVREVLDDVRNEMSGKAFEVSSPDSWPWAIGYTPWVMEVWSNYLTNAVKYGGTPPILTLGYDRKPACPGALDEGTGEPQPVVRFWVRDNGNGLKGEQIARLFAPFSRLDPSRSTGHGLGLWIVQRIVTRLGGQVGAYSEPGQGTTFWFTLPCEETPEDTQNGSSAT